MIASMGRADQRELPRIATPTGLRVAIGAIVVLVVGLAALGAFAIAEQQRAVESVGSSATPLLTSAEGLYLALADADAAASTSFLRAGPASVELGDRYDADIQEAGLRLAEVGRDADVTAEASAAVAVINAAAPGLHRVVWRRPGRTTGSGTRWAGRRCAWPPSR